MNYLGIDVGGTNLKGAVVTENGEVVREALRPTQAARGADIVADAIGELICELAAQEELGGVGLGCPGIVDNGRGEIVYSCNLNWVKYPLREKLKQRTGYEVELVNDANAAALEHRGADYGSSEVARAYYYGPGITFKQFFYALYQFFFNIPCFRSAHSAHCRKVLAYLHLTQIKPFGNRGCRDVFFAC